MDFRHPCWLGTGSQCHADASGFICLPVAAQLDGVGLGSNMTNEIDQMMRNVGVAVGLAALLKGTAYHAQRCVA